MNNAGGISPICSFRDVTIAYRDATAVSHVTFDVPSGALMCLVGANGAGKSSLLQAAVGLLAYQGVIDKSVGPTEIAYVSQRNTASHQFPATVYEVVHSGRQRKGRLFCRHEDHAIVDQTLDMLHINTIRNRPISHLSGGQLQRVRLARALCARPKLLVLDEPVSGLDELVSRDLYAIMRDWVKHNEVTILMASHELNGIENIADTLAAVDCGGIGFVGSPADWLALGRPGL